jgi:hypothetical protein
VEHREEVWIAQMEHREEVWISTHFITDEHNKSVDALKFWLTLTQRRELADSLCGHLELTR